MICAESTREPDRREGEASAGPRESRPQMEPRSACRRPAAKRCVRQPVAYGRCPAANCICTRSAVMLL